MKYNILHLLLLILPFTSCEIPKFVMNEGSLTIEKSKKIKPKKPTREEILNSWIGKSKNELLMKWGMANRNADDGKGGQILAYEKRRSLGGFISGNYFENSFVHYTEIFVDSNNMIYYWRIGTR